MKNLLWSLCLVVVATSLTTASAATKTWTGATDANWSTGGNWSPAGTPATGDDLVFPAAAANQSPSTNDLAPGTSFSSITISGGTYSIDGNAITLTSPAAVSVTSAVTTGQSINLPITLTNIAATVDTQAVSGFLNLNGTLTTPTGGVLNLITSTTIIYPDAIDGSGGLSTSGAGQVVLQSVATHTGTTAIAGPGDFFVDSGGGLPDNGVVDVASGATFNIFQNETIGTLTGAGMVNVSTFTLTIAGPASSIFSGDFQGSGTVELRDWFSTNGSSPLFTGTINVHAAGGWLQSSGFNGPTTNVTANNSISSYVDSTFSNITTNSSFEAGSGGSGSAGDITVINNLDLQSGGDFNVYPNGSNSNGVVNVGGNVNITSTNLNVDNANGFVPTVAGPVMTIINKTSGGPVSGTFTSRPEGAVFTPTGTTQPYRITYLGGTGNDVVMCPDNAGFDATCNPTALVNGACGADNGVATIPAPSLALCAAGTPTVVSVVGPDYVWSCDGISGGSSVSCSAPQIPGPVDGVCGTADGVAVPVAPVSNLCAAGVASPVIFSSPNFTWDCAGTGGGATLACSAPYDPGAPVATDDGDRECKKPKSAPRNLSVQKLATGVRAIWDAPKAKRSVTIEYTGADGKKTRVYVKKGSAATAILPAGAHDVRAALKNSCGKGPWTSKKN
jgi:fibronectin-binding autotransporter adhesin